MSILPITRHKIILEELEKLPQEPITGNALAKLCEVSSKTIRSDIQQLNHIFHEHGATISSLQGKGYFLRIDHPSAYQTQRLQYLQKQQDLPSGTIDRSKFIIRALLRSHDYLRIEDLSEQLFIDRTSISRDMRVVRDFLNSYELTLLQRPAYGMSIQGDELHKRICMNEIFTIDMMDEIFPISKKCIDAISTVLDTDGISMIDASFENFCIYIHIMLDRIHHHQPMVLKEEVIHALKQEYEYQVAKDIIHVLQQEFALSFEEQEICFLSVHLIGKRMNFISDVESCLVDILPEEVDTEVTSLVQHIHTLYGIDFSNDYYLRKALGLHIIAMKNRVRFATYLKNPLLHQIRMMYLLAYEISVDIWMFLHPSLRFLFSEDEIAYFAIHIQYALERSGVYQKKKKVLLINNLNSSSTELLTYELINRFDSFMEIKDSIYPRRLNEYDLQNYDVILSTTPLLEVKTTPVITISSILDRESLARIGSFFLNRNTRSLGSYVNEEDIQFAKGIENREMALAYFEEKISKRFSTKYDVSTREHIGSTALTNMIALPHSILDIEQTFCSLLILDKPIVWNTLMIQIIFFCASPKGKCDLFFYEVLSRFLQEPSIEDVLISMNKQQILEYINQYY